MRDVGEKTLIKTLVLENMLLTDYNTSPYLKCTDLQVVLMDQAKLSGYHGYYFILFFSLFFLFILFVDKLNW